MVWPDIKAALDRGHSVKVVHERFVKAGVDISYRLFAPLVSCVEKMHRGIWKVLQRFPSSRCRHMAPGVAQGASQTRTRPGRELGRMAKTR
jgi:hypothetical protein